MTRWPTIATVMAALAAALTAPAGAAEIAVTTTADELGAGGGCSLREAVAAANADAAAGGCPAGSGADRVLVPQGTYVLTRHGAGEDANATGDLDVTGDLTLSGAGIVDGDGADRVLDARTATATVILEGLTVRGGRAPDGTAGLPVTGGEGQDATGSAGTPGAAGGGIRAAGSLTLRDCRVQDNRAGDGGAGGAGTGGTAAAADGRAGVGGAGGDGGAGGGVAASGPLIVERCVVTGNAAGDGGDGGRGFGGAGGTGAAGGAAQGAAGGAGGDGGGVWGQGGLTVTDSTVSRNASGAGGDGGSASGGVGGNATGGGTGGTGGTAFGGGGGVGGLGGGIAHAGSDAPVDRATVQRSTLADNAAGTGGTGGAGTGGIGGTGGPADGDGGAGGEGRGGSGAGASAAALTTAGRVALENVTFHDNVLPAGAPGGASTGGIGGHGLGTGDGGAGGSARGSRGGAGASGGIVRGQDLDADHTTFWGTIAGGPGPSGAVVAGPGGAPGQTGGSHGGPGATVPGTAGDPVVGRHLAAATAVLRASILGPGSGSGCAATAVLVDGGGNLAPGDPSCPGLDAEARLRPIADNGGPTPTMGLDPGSPARDAIPAAGCPATDQRGHPRPAGAACDAGAYEAASPDVVTGTATGVGLTTATIPGRVAANFPGATAWVEFGTSTAYGSASPGVPVPGGRAPADVVVDLAGLQPETTYHYRVVARSADGTTAGGDATFTTAPRPDTTRPRLRRVALDGRRLRFTLSEPAAVTVRAERCGARRKRRCRAWVITGTARIRAQAGRTTRTLPRRLFAGRGLRRLVVTARDGAGNRGTPKRLRVR